VKLWAVLSNLNRKCAMYALNSWICYSHVSNIRKLGTTDVKVMLNE